MVQAELFADLRKIRPAAPGTWEEAEAAFVESSGRRAPSSGTADWTQRSRSNFAIADSLAA